MAPRWVPVQLTMHRQDRTGARVHVDESMPGRGQEGAARHFDDSKTFLNILLS
jgi:hypothetical protein